MERPKRGVARDLSEKAEWAIVTGRAMDGTGILEVLVLQTYRSAFRLKFSYARVPSGVLHRARMIKQQGVLLPEEDRMSTDELRRRYQMPASQTAANTPELEPEILEGAVPEEATDLSAEVDTQQEGAEPLEQPTEEEPIDKAEPGSPLEGDAETIGALEPAAPPQLCTATTRAVRDMWASWRRPSRSATY